MTLTGRPPSPSAFMPRRPGGWRFGCRGGGRLPRGDDGSRVRGPSPVRSRLRPAVSGREEDCPPRGVVPIGSRPGLGARLMPPRRLRMKSIAVGTPARRRPRRHGLPAGKRPRLQAYVVRRMLKRRPEVGLIAVGGISGAVSACALTPWRAAVSGSPCARAGQGPSACCRPPIEMLPLMPTHTGSALSCA